MSPNADDEGVWGHQNAWFSMGQFTAKTEVEYTLHDRKNGLYLFLIEGEIEIAGQQLERRDGMGIWDVPTISFITNPNTKVLVMEVPMEI